MRISDWSSDVCSSDLLEHLAEQHERHHDPGGLVIDRHSHAVPAEGRRKDARHDRRDEAVEEGRADADRRSEEHTSELQSLMRISYAAFCLKKKKPQTPMQ